MTITGEINDYQINNFLKKVFKCMNQYSMQLYGCTFRLYAEEEKHSKLRQIAGLKKKKLQIVLKQKQRTIIQKPQLNE